MAVYWFCKSCCREFQGYVPRGENKCDECKSSLLDQEINVCHDHGEYNQEDQYGVGIDSGCPVCFQIDEEDIREETRLADGC